MKSCIIVGGGISGLFAGILAADKYDKVTIVEANDNCGGLLRSWTNENGATFDYGTHILSETGNDEVNKILFKGIYENPELWHSFTVTKVSNSFNHKIFSSSQFVPLQYLEFNEYKSALAEILLAQGQKIEDAAHLEEYALNNYGETITNKILAPLMQKMQGEKLTELDPVVHQIFALNRFIPGGDTLSKNLKKSSELDDKLAFYSYFDGLSGVKRFYPKSGGISLWVEHLIDQAKSLGVEIVTGTSVAKMHHSNGVIKRVILSNGEQLNVDHVIWTVPPIFAINSLMLNYQAQAIVKFCPMSLHHLQFDKPFKDENYYTNINESDANSFRVTFYPNLQDVDTYHCTVEVLRSDFSGETLSKMVANELKKFGYVDEKAELIASECVDIPVGFPVFSKKLVKEKNSQIDCIEENIENITLLGKSSRQEFFVYGVIIETYEKIKNLIKVESFE